jgi:hypothetical protein
MWCISLRQHILLPIFARRAKIGNNKKIITALPKAETAFWDVFA